MQFIKDNGIFLLSSVLLASLIGFASIAGESTTGAVSYDSSSAAASTTTTKTATQIQTVSSQVASDTPTSSASKNSTIPQSSQAPAATPSVRIRGGDDEGVDD